jgi:DNA-binding transcriptional regulator YhcF (GntR family)
MKFDANLASYATVRDLEYLEALEKYGSIGQVAKQLNVHRKTIHKALDRLKTRAAIAGYSPEHDMVHPVPDGFKVRGVSTYYNNDGKAVGQWVKSGIDEERQQEIFREALEALKEELPRIDLPLPTVIARNDDLMNVYVITDYHIGMMADQDETGGADWDTKKSEELFVKWFATAAQLAPNSKIGVLCNLGDLLHADGMIPETPHSKHVLDVDTRFQKVVRIAIRMIRRAIEILSQKHEQLHIIMADANHDPASGAWLRELLAAMYDHNPHISVDTSMDTYYCVEHGKTLVFFHHGHRKKMEKIDNVFVAKFRKKYGMADHCYAHMGHLHHDRSLETNLMTVERHRTLAPADAYASKSGYISGRDAKVITYSKRFGEVGRLIINPDMVNES